MLGQFMMHLAPIEFKFSLQEIRGSYGDDGVTDYVEVPPQFTDDTQMLLFTAEGYQVCRKGCTDREEES